MIEDKKNKIKIAENKHEKFWNDVIKAREQDIETSKQNLIYQEAILEMAKKEAIKASQKKKK